MRLIDADALIMALRLEYPMMPMFKESRKEWEEKTEGYRKSEEIINDAPTIDAVSEWIPCEERLPKEGQMVLTTTRGHDVIIPQEGETLEEAIERIWNDVCYVSIGFIGSDGWYGADGFPQVVHPIAWMPLPKPYERSDNGKDIQSATE